MNPASIAVEAAKVATGDSSMTKLAGYVLLAIAVDAVCKSGGNHMLAPIFIPEGYTLPVFIILIAFAIVAPVVTGLFFKNESKHKDEKWTGRYYSTLLLDVIVTPVLGLLIISWIVQQWSPLMDPITYMVFLPIVMLVVAYFTLKILNEGIKAVVEQLLKIKSDVQYAQDQLQPKQ